MVSYRVWHLISNRWYSAISEYALRSAIALDQIGCESLLSPLAHSPLHKKALDAGLAVDPTGSFAPTPNSLRWLYRSLSRFNPDLIICYGGPESFLLHFLPKKHRKIIRFRGKNEDVTAPPKSSLSHRHIDAILTPSKLVSERLSSLQKPVHSVVLGLDTKRFSLNSDAFARSPRPSLCIVGRFDPVKGHKTFLKTFARLIDLWDEPYDLPVLKIIGEPANLSAEDLKCEAERLGLLDRGVLTIIDARVPDIASHMRSCHLGVVSSEGSEVICRVAEEFLLSGTQIAVSGVGSLRECLFDEAAGFSFHDLQGDKLVKKLKNQLVKAYEEPFDMRLKRAQKARELFSYEAMGQGLLTLFDQLNN